LVKQDMAVTEDTLEAAKALVKQEIPLTKEKIEFVAQPQRVTQSIEVEALARGMVQRLADNGEPRDVVIEALQFLVEDGSPMDSATQPIPETNEATIKETLQWLPKVKDAHQIAAQIQGKA